MCPPALLLTGQLLDPSAKRPKGDLDMVKRLPVMRLSMVVQRLVEMERRVSRTCSLGVLSTQPCWSFVRATAAVRRASCSLQLVHHRVRGRSF